MELDDKSHQLKLHAIMGSEFGYAFYSLDHSGAPSGEKLLQYVREKKIKKATSALVDGTNPDFPDPETGNTALHVAVLVRSEILVKLLIVFNAKLTLKNKNDQTALDIALGEGAPDIAQVIQDILDAQKDLESDLPKALGQQAAASDSSEAAEECLMLSLDGGGIRGLVFTQVLLEMEKRRKKLYPSTPRTLLSTFNWITGNSTGGIAAVAFAAAKKTVEQGRKLYFDLKDKVLGGDPPIPNDRVDRVFQKVYGTKAMMSDIKGINVSVMTTLATKNPPILHIMSNYGGARNGQEPPNEQLVWKAARATSAVPVFFHPQDNIYLDGGLIANNPTTDAIVDMFEYAKSEKKKLKLKMVLSLGCGFDQPKPVPVDDIDFEPSEIGDGIAHLMDKLYMHKKGEDAQELFLVLHNHKAFLQLSKIVSTQITQPNGEVLKRSKFISEMLGAKYFRINPPIDSVDSLTTDDEILIIMLYQVVYYMLKNCREITDPVLECIYGH